MPLVLRGRKEGDGRGCSCGFGSSQKRERCFKHLVIRSRTYYPGEAGGMPEEDHLLTIP